MSEVTEKRAPNTVEASATITGKPWFIDPESRRQRVEEAQITELRICREMIAPFGLVVDAGPILYGDRLEAFYGCRLKDALQDEEATVYLRGRNRPMTEHELGEHFTKQAKAIMARRGQPEVACTRPLAQATGEYVGGALVAIAEDMARNAAR